MSNALSFFSSLGKSYVETADKQEQQKRQAQKDAAELELKNRELDLKEKNKNTDAAPKTTAAQQSYEDSFMHGPPVPSALNQQTTPVFPDAAMDMNDALKKPASSFSAAEGYQGLGMKPALAAAQSSRLWGMTPAALQSMSQSPEYADQAQTLANLGQQYTRNGVQLAYQSFQNGKPEKSMDILRHYVGANVPEDARVVQTASVNPHTGKEYTTSSLQDGQGNVLVGDINQAFSQYLA